MMRTLLAVTLCLCCFVVTSAAQDPDVAGIFFDLEGTDICEHTLAPFASVVAYLMICDASTAESISGYELSVQLEGADPVAPQWTLMGGVDHDSSPDGFLVEFPAGELVLPVSPRIILASWSGFIMHPYDYVSFTIRPRTGSIDNPDDAVYWVDSLVEPTITTLGTVGGEYARDADINNGMIHFPWECQYPWIVDNETTTWSSLKALYR